MRRKNQLQKSHAAVPLIPTKIKRKDHSHFHNRILVPYYLLSSSISENHLKPIKLFVIDLDLKNSLQLTILITCNHTYTHTEILHCIPNFNPVVPPIDQSSSSL